MKRVLFLVCILLTTTTAIATNVPTDAAGNLRPTTARVQQLTILEPALVPTNVLRVEL